MLGKQGSATSGRARFGGPADKVFLTRKAAAHCHTHTHTRGTHSVWNGDGLYSNACNILILLRHLRGEKLSAGWACICSPPGYKVVRGSVLESPKIFSPCHSRVFIYSHINLESMQLKSQKCKISSFKMFFCASFQIDISCDLFLSWAKITIFLKRK